MLRYEKYKLLRVKISCTKLEKKIYRNIAFPIGIKNIKILKILQESIPGSTILTYQEEKVISVCDDMESSTDRTECLIDKYWIDGKEYVIEVNEKNNENNQVLVISQHDTNINELLKNLESLISSDKKIIIDELADCWILKKNYCSILSPQTCKGDRIQY